MTTFDPLGPSLPLAFRFDLLDAGHGVIGEVHPVRGGITISQRASGAVKRQMSGFTLPPSEAVDVNPIRDRIRPVWVGEGSTSHPLGVFLWADASARRRTSGDLLDSTLHDYGLRLSQPIEGTISFPSGSRHHDALRAVADAAGFLDADIDETPGRFVAPQAWIGSAQSTWYTVLATIGMDHAGMFDPYFNSAGRLRMRYAGNLAATIPSIRYDEDGRVQRDSVVVSSNLLTAPNRYIVRDTAAAISPITLVYDIPPDAPHSVENRGWRVIKYVDVQGIASMGDAFDIAVAAYRQDTDAYEEVSWSSIIDPRHESFDVVSLLGLDYLETEWSITTVGTMTHRAKRVAHGELLAPSAVL